MFANKKREGLNTFLLCAVTLYVADGYRRKRDVLKLTNVSPGSKASTAASQTRTTGKFPSAAQAKLREQIC